MKFFLITAWSFACVAAAAAALLELPVTSRPGDAPGGLGHAQFVRELADAKTCRLRHGEASFTRNIDSRLVCIPRRGPAILQKDED